MRTTAVAAGVALTLGAPAAFAGSPAFEDYARVRDVTVDNWESRVTGYRVAYEYQGRGYTTILPYDPGQRLPVRVSVEPAAGGDRWGR